MERTTAPRWFTTFRKPGWLMAPSRSKLESIRMRSSPVNSRCGTSKALTSAAVRCWSFPLGARCFTRRRFTYKRSAVQCRSCVWSCSRFRTGWRMRRRSSAALAALFRSGSSTLEATASSQPGPVAPTAGGTAPSAPNFTTLASEAAKDLSDYQRLTAEGKLGEAGQKLEDLKKVLEKLNTSPK